MQKTNSDAQIKKQLLNLMIATKELIDAKNKKGAEAEIDLAIEKIKKEYLASALLVKQQSANNRIAALLRPREQSVIDAQMYSFKEQLSVSLAEPS